MFPRRNRLSRPEFALVSSDRSAKRLTSLHFSIVISRAEGVQGCSVVVAKKVAKSSVSRHLLKRRIRESVRLWSSGNYGFIVFARAGSASLSFADLSSELQQLLSQVPK
jgi:ribonuclease P protein component